MELLPVPCKYLPLLTAFGNNWDNIFLQKSSHITEQIIMYLFSNKTNKKSVFLFALGQLNWLLITFAEKHWENIERHGAPFGKFGDQYQFMSSWISLGLQH